MMKKHNRIYDGPNLLNKEIINLNNELEELNKKVVNVRKQINKIQDNCDHEFYLLGYNGPYEKNYECIYCGLK